MFVAGLETDLDEMRRVGKVAFWAAFGGVVLPMAGGIATAVLFELPRYWEAIFIGTILTATSVSISAQTLMEIGAGDAAAAPGDIPAASVYRRRHRGGNHRPPP